MYEYKTLFADAPPNAENLTRLGAEGWLMVQLVPFVPYGPDKYVLYLVRETAN